MNPDLAMGDELLKKTGAGNLFMVFGEPDMTMRQATRRQLTVEIRGLDVYDPTTGEIRSSSTDDIACWFIDTDYNGESFFVRHAYFTGGRRTVRQTQARPPRRSRRGRLVGAVQHPQPPVRPARDGQDRRQGHQPLRG